LTILLLSARIDSSIIQLVTLNKQHAKALGVVIDIFSGV